MAVTEIHITSAGVFKPLNEPFLNGKYTIQIVGDLGSGTITLQARVRTEDLEGNEESYSDIYDLSSGSAFSFTAAQSFEADLNCQVQATMTGGSSHDCYVLFREVKTVKI